MNRWNMEVLYFCHLGILAREIWKILELAVEPAFVAYGRETQTLITSSESERQEEQKKNRITYRLLLRKSNKTGRRIGNKPGTTSVY